MKNKLAYFILGIVLISAFVSGCTKNFQDINTDPNGTSNAYPQQLMTAALVNTMNYNMIRNRNFNNELMQVTVNQSDADGTVFRYDFPVSWSNYLYNGWYGTLVDFRDMYLLAKDSVVNNPSYMGIARICEAWVYSLLTDTYGDIPFTEALLGRDSLNFTPKFDTQKDVYAGIFSYLEEADTLLAKGSTISGSYDPVYSGDVSKWRKFGNSLYLRLLMRISGKSEVQDEVKAKIAQIVNNPSLYPIMTSNSDAAVLQWTGAGPLVSPWMSIREQDFRSPAICSFFIDNLVTWSDPRINYALYGTSGICRYRIATYSGAYVGIPSGYVAGTGEDKKSYFTSTSSAVTLMNDPMTGQIMNYGELQLLLSEAALKGYISGDPETYYKNGVQASIQLWLPTWPLAGDDIQNIDQYLDRAEMTWDDNASFDQKMEKIMLEKYYALFCTDMQQWFEYRRTGYPTLPKGQGLQNGGVMPARMQYPAYLIGSNPTNYAAAIADQGADAISTQVWWQKADN